MSVISYHHIILDSVIKRHRLIPPRLEIVEPYPPFTARVTVHIESRDYQFLSNCCRFRDNAEDEACRQAIIGLEKMGYKRIHFKSELNNIVKKEKKTLDFARDHSGLDNQRIHASTIKIDGQLLQHYKATSTKEKHADDLACKLFLEAKYSEYRY